MTIEELKEKIDVLEDKCDVLLDKFEKFWWDSERVKHSPDDFFVNFQEYNRQRMAAGGEDLLELRKLRTLYRMTREPALSPLSTYGSVMSLKSFIANCRGGGFIDDDGFGHYVTDGQETDIEIYPSDVKDGDIRKEYDTIIWFNR